MDWISKIALDHDKWVSMASYLGAGDYSEDMVQDMYLKLNQYSNTSKCFTNEKINSGYIFYVLRSIVFQHSKIISRIDTCYINGYDPKCDESMDEIIAYDIIERKIEKILNGLHWYDAKLFRLYRDTGLSYRDLAEEIDISFVSIYNTVKNVKNLIKDQIGEDYQDYKNGDYERL